MQRLRDDIEKILFTREQIHEREEELGKQITEDFAEDDLVMVGILKGAGVFMCDLMREVDMPIRIDFMGVSSYGNFTQSSGQVKIVKDLSQNVRDCSVLLVEDIVDTGHTLHFLKQYMYDRGAKIVKICSLLDKPDRREQEVEIDYRGFTVPNKFIVGYGIDYAEHYRNLPFVATLKPDCFQ